MLEIRGHARGGQGMVTAFEILAKIFSKLGDYHVQSFPAFGVERTGAPIQAFLRVAKGEIYNRSNVYNPHLIVVFDESLLEQVPVFDGLREGGSVLLNTERLLENFKEKAESVFTVPATKISLEKGLGSKSLPIVNAAMIGAIIKLIDADIDIAKAVVAANVPVKPEANAEASEIAFNSIVGLGKSELNLNEFLNTTKIDENPVDDDFLKSVGEPEIDKFSEPYWSQPMSLNKTGNWRVLTPEYTTKLAPCSSNCPAGTDVREFIKLSGEGKFEDAVEIIYKHNPFPAVCGRVCPHFCEQACNRNELDEGVNIGAVERFLGDRFRNTLPEKTPIRYEEKIGVIGGGPAGLTAALQLRRRGYDVTVFEAAPQAGGMMRTGIPKFRLPDVVLDEEIERIRREGVKIVTDKKMKISDLEDEFAAAIVAVGSHIGSKMHVENEDQIIDGIDFLYDFKLKGDKYGIEKGDEIAIIGGGNTAIDVARTSLRLGAVPTIYYRRTSNEMPAIAHEVDEAIAEGVKIEFLTAPIGVTGNGKNLIVSMTKMELGEPDESGRRRPLPVQGSEYEIKANKVIAAIGQRFDEFVFDGNKVEPAQGKMNIDSKIPVFCAGDMAWGGTVTEAIGSGNKVSDEVHAYFRSLPYSHEENHPNVVMPVDINFTYYLPTPRINNIVKYDIDLFDNFDEVVEGLKEEEIVKETSRCMHCGECFSCGNCYNYCPDAAIHIDDGGRLRIDYDYCKGCGICVQECPCSAMTFNLKEVVYE